MLKFICIGAQKSGTTWLYHQLSQIEQVRFPGGKEIHYWNARYRHEPLSWYQALFSRDERLIEGDITPAYATLDIDTIRRVHRHYPAIKILFILRNPIERAWSSALMAMQRAELELDEVSDQWFVDHFNSRGSRARGAYEATLRRWRDVFGEGAVSVLMYDDIKTRPFEVMAGVCEFLQLPLPAAKLEKANERVFAGPGFTIRPGLIPILTDLYRNDIHSLSDYLNKDLSHWLNQGG
jgi:hypothetical protein